MKKMFLGMIVLALVLTAAGCGKEPPEEAPRAVFEAEILEVQEAYYIVKPAEGSWERSCADQITVPIGRIEPSPETGVGDTVRIEYDGAIGETYPAQIMKVYSIQVVKEVAQTEPQEAEPPQKHAASADAWGITLKVEKVTPTSLTLLCSQSGGAPTGELETGSWFAVEAWSEDGWIEVPYVPMEGELAWTMEAYSIPKEKTTTFEINWEFLYGELPAGSYRISKQIMDFRGTGDYDTALCFAEFEIME